MPELPEVQTVVNNLSTKMINRYIRNVECPNQYTKVFSNIKLLDFNKNVCNKKISDTELQKAKNGIITSIVEELTTNANKAAKVVQFETLFGDYNKLFKLISVYNCITINQVQEIAQKYFNNNKRTIIHLLPAK